MIALFVVCLFRLEATGAKAKLIVVYPSGKNRAVYRGGHPYTGERQLYPSGCQPQGIEVTETARSNGDWKPCSI